MWKLSSIPLNNKLKNKRKIRKYFEINENEEITCQNLGEIAKAVVKVKFIVIN